jgi:hypothetical protein
MRGMILGSSRLQAFDHGLSIRPSAKDAIKHAHHEVIGGT